MYLRWSMRSVIVVLVVAAGLLGCPSRKPEAVDASAPEFVVGGAGEDAGAIDAGPPAPTTLEPIVVAAFADGGTIPLTASATIEPPTAFTITLPVRLKDFRLRLIDWRDQVVSSDDELLADGVTYLVTLTEPLKTGRGYTFALDAELGPVVTALNGATFNDWELAFRISGEVQPETPARKTAPKKSGKKK